ncbi:MaoC/PaaZ C-terminal domain-containing protein [Nocardioides sp.]|uniref:MaoC/PaaZ C-terminal domain-containing protein n=1 Tax=Nocardioides sp. TaxID=35761 RepID=UPI00261E108F|nr:MaoC/PaaZ C-terminal domain-containing protein [Nocardioides sp.]
MPINLEAALSAPPATREIAWTQRDALLYHLSLGAGRPVAGKEFDPELRWTYERDLQVLPTFAAVAGGGISAGDRPAAGLHLPGIEVDLYKLLHSGQEVTVHRPLPAAGTATVTTRVAHLWDKGKAAVIVLEHSAVSPEGEPLWTNVMQIWARGEGGFGGEAGPEETWVRPEREPDLVIDAPTGADQALLYRLNGDLNPLHVDPEFAAKVGMDAPILHGLASYGIVAKALVDGALDGDAARLESFAVRFAGTLLPGETLRTSVWREDGELRFVATCPERSGAVVLSHGTAQVSA